MKKIFLSLIIYFLFINIYGQESDGSLDYQFSSRQLSPQAYQFARYGNVPAKQFVGELDLSIPLYTYQDRDFVIPISLQYNGTGFSPNKMEGIIGLDWSLIVGGAIVRNVQGVQDEEYSSSLNAYGVLIASKLNAYGNSHSQFNEKIERDSVLGIANGDGANTLAYNPGNYTLSDLASDKFSFSMPGHSGQFNIGWDGKALIKGDVPYRVLFSDNFTYNQYGTKTITIIAPDGYQYVFGGKKEAEETSTFFPAADNNDVQIQETFTTTWYLCKIIAPNKREVEFFYKPVAEPTIEDNIRKYFSGHASLLLRKNLRTKTASYTLNTTTFRINEVSLNSENSTDDMLTYELVRQSCLEKIVIDQKTTITFAYKEKDKKFYEDNEIPTINFKPFNTKNLQMTGFNVNYNNQLIKNVTFRQEYLGNTNATRLFLTGVTAGNETYICDYYNTNLIPRPHLSYIDHWGYYNGSPILIPSLEINIFPPLGGSKVLDINSQQGGRTANEELSKVGMLRRVVYPTGGGSIFYYGLHTYQHLVEKDALNNKEKVTSLNDALDPTIRKAGGARINKIEDFDGDGNVRTVREFTYNKGILIYYPNYFLDLISLGSQSSNSPMAILYTNTIGRDAYPSEKYIQYAEVIEKAPNDGVSIYRYTSYLDSENRDEYNLTSKDYTFGYHLQKHSDWSPIYEVKGTDRSYRRGLLKEKAYCNNANDTLYKEITEYKLQTASVPNYTMAFGKGYVVTGYKYKIENYAFLPEETKRYEYRGGNPIIQTSKTIYNNQYFIRSIIDVENYLTTNYSYPMDFKTISPYNHMINKNNISPVIEKTVNKNAIPLFTQSTEYGFQIFNSNRDTLCLPKATYMQYRNENTKTLHTQFNNYDAYGNPVSVTNIANLSNVYLWGYRGIYPIAAISNASYAQVKTALNNTLPESLSSADIPNMTKIENLRNNSELMDAHITTYTYQPLVGLLSETKPNGTKTFYAYDSYNRLETIKDHEQKNLSTYSYNMNPYPPIDFYVAVNSSYSLRDQVQFITNASGGSGQFSYSWVLRNASGAVLSQSNSNSISYKFNDPCSASVSCTVTDIVSGKTKNQTTNFSVVIFPVSLMLSYVATEYLLNTQNNFTITVQGGSGNFTYNWYLKNASDQTVQSGTGSTFTPTFSQKGNMKLVCQVTDTKTNTTTEIVSNPFTVMGILVTINPVSGSEYVTNVQNFSAIVTGGSGNYQYTWKIKENATNTILAQSPAQTNNNQYSVQLNKIGEMTIICTVRDLTTSVEEETSKLFTIVPPPIQFSNITRGVYLTTGYKITAEINCYEATNIKFSYTTGYGRATYKIGSTSFELAPTSNTPRLNGERTILLPKGNTSIEFILWGPNADASLTILEIIGNNTNNSIGIDRVLHINI